MQAKRSFASDNNASVHPQILKAITQANEGHAVAYGDDAWTERAKSKFKAAFGRDIDVFFVFNGTAGNVLSIKSATKPHNAVICTEMAHINVDECGAPERFTGCKLLSCPAPDGKLTVEAVYKHYHGIGDQHHVQPKLISITQSTELGTVYTAEEVKKLAAFAHSHKMYLHMDGARLANAAVKLKLNLKQASKDLGVDILTFGGTKNGLLGGEAVVFFKKELAKDFRFIRKQGMQLSSKMRYTAAQFDALLTDDLWRKNATRANKMAKLLASELKEISVIEVSQKVDANGVFARVPPKLIPRLQKEYFFYVWNASLSEVRWMASFDTTEEDVMNFVACIKKLIR